MSKRTASGKTAGDEKALTPRDWYGSEGHGRIATRGEVWALMGWHYHRFVEPQLGLAGFLRRLWWRLTRQRMKLLSPWQQLAIRAQALAEAETARQAVIDATADDEPPPPAIEVVSR